jgi:hypothetical protein
MVIRMRPVAAVFIGIPCSRCGSLLRYQSSASCVACAQSRSREHTGARLDRPRVRKRLGLPT